MAHHHGAHVLHTPRSDRVHTGGQLTLDGLVSLCNKAAEPANVSVKSGGLLGSSARQSRQLISRCLVWACASLVVPCNRLLSCCVDCINEIRPAAGRGSTARRSRIAKANRLVNSLWQSMVAVSA